MTRPAPKIRKRKTTLADLRAHRAMIEPLLDAALAARDAEALPVDHEDDPFEDTND